MGVAELVVVEMGMEDERTRSVKVDGEEVEEEMLSVVDRKRESREEIEDVEEVSDIREMRERRD